MLPFEPESVIALKERYPEAMKDIVNPQIVAADPSLAPSKKRKHVFDFHNGLRLIASNEQSDDTRITHYSASMRSSNLFDKLSEFIIFVVESIDSLRPAKMTGQLITQVNEGGILHLLYSETQELAPSNNVQPMETICLN